MLASRFLFHRGPERWGWRHSWCSPTGRTRRWDSSLASPRLAGPSRAGSPGHRSPEDSRHFFLYEQYVDEAALAAHRSSPHFEEYVQRGLFRIIESRTPRVWTSLDFAARAP
jgi:hypothetical protein